MGTRVLGVLRTYANRVEFYAPDLAFEDAGRWLPSIIERKRGDPVRTRELFGLIQTLVIVLDTEVYQPFEAISRERIGHRDPDDWPILASALALNCPIWTEDTDFFGCGVATWTTDRVEIFLSDSARSVM